MMTKQQPKLQQPKAPPSTSSSSSVHSPSSYRQGSVITAGRTTPPHIQTTSHHNSGNTVASSVQNSPTASHYSTTVGGGSPSNARGRMEECDYDRAPTILYKTIEKKAWAELLKLFEDADSDDDEVSYNSNEAPSKTKRRSVKQEASIWVVRKERDGRLRWRLLPLHAALIFDAPLPVIEALLRAFPAAATLKDDQGMLPLHLCCRNAPTNFPVMEELLTAHPAAVYVKDRKGRTPIQGGLAATGSDKNPGLSAMELYTQIAAAGEKQRWRTEHEQQTLQKLQLLASQHDSQMASLKQEYEAKLLDQQQRHEMAQRTLSAQLKAAHLSHDETKRELDQARARLKTCSSEEHDKVVRINKQLHAMLELVLDQHASLQESLQTMQRDQAKWHEQRNQIMRNYCSINEQAAATAQAHASIWQEELSATEVHVQESLRQMGLDELVFSSRTTPTAESKAGDASVGARSPTLGTANTALSTPQQLASQGSSTTTEPTDNKSMKQHDTGASPLTSPANVKSLCPTSGNVDIQNNNISKSTFWQKSRSFSLGTGDTTKKRASTVTVGAMWSTDTSKSLNDNVPAATVNLSFSWEESGDGRDSQISTNDDVEHLRSSTVGTTSTRSFPGTTDENGNEHANLLQLHSESSLSTASVSAEEKKQDDEIEGSPEKAGNGQNDLASVVVSIDGSLQKPI